MPSDEYCPVVRSYLNRAKEHWEQTGVSGLYDEVIEELEDLREYARAQPFDPASQRLRAFFCLHRLFILLSTRTGGPVRELPLTREGIQELIQFCAKIRDAEELILYVKQLDPKHKFDDRDAWENLSRESLFGITDVLVDAAKYLRPRLHNGKTLSGMGSYFARGLSEVRAPSDRFILYGRSLINVSIHNRGGVTL